MRNRILSSLLVFCLLLPGTAFAGGEPQLIGVHRITGADRYATAANICLQGWEGMTPKYVVLARGDQFADALAGVPLAYSLGAPILLTDLDKLPGATKEALLVLGAEKVILLGGSQAISSGVEDELYGMGLATERIGGANRFDTAASIARRLAELGKYNAGVVVASAADFPDALAASSYAAVLGYPIVLVEKDKIPDFSREVLMELSPDITYIAGGTAAINSEVEAGLQNPKRVYGADRFATAVNLAKEFRPDESMFYVATGLNFADAIAGSVLAARKNAGLLLVAKEVPAAVREYMGETAAGSVTIFGGTAAVSDALARDLDALLTLPQSCSVGVEARDAEGRPIKGAQFSFRSAEYYGTGQTDNTGKGALRLPAGVYDLQVWAEGYLGCQEPLLVTSSQTVRVTLEPQGALHRVEFSVADQGGRPIRDASVIARQGGYLASGWTDSRGVAVLEMPAGDYLVRVHSRAFGVSEESLSVPDVTKLKVVLPGFTVVFTLADQEGLPVKGAAVQVSNAEYSLQETGYTDAEGKVLFSLPTGVWGCAIRAAGFARRDDTFSVQEDIEQEILLTRAYAVRFAVTGEGGSPLEAAHVWVENDGFYDSGNTDSSGEITLYLSAGDYDYNVTADGYRSLIGSLAVAKNRELAIILVPEGITSRTFIVADEAGKPVANAYVWASGDSHYSGYTDAAGKVILSLPKGAYDWGVEAQGFYDYADYLAANSDGTLTVKLCPLGETHLVRISVVDEGGRPVEGAQVRARGGDYTRQVLTDESGFAIFELPVTGFSFFVIKEGFVAAFASLTPAAHTELEIGLQHLPD